MGLCDRFRENGKRTGEFFKRVIASDPSASQIGNAERLDGIDYRVAVAKASQLESESIDHVTLSQTLHWFRRDDFFKEADGVLKPNGVLAVWSYNLRSSHR